ncbi:MAG: double-cubane-cluster-containing anaerobic reductase [Desulfomicrobium sp.]
MKNTPDSVVSALQFFEKFSEHCLAALETAREEGRPIAGVYCIYAPLEIIRAAGCVPIGLCGKRQDPIQAAEAVLPASLCPLIKSSYGYAKTDTCPFFSAADFIIAETTCDGKKKMYEFLGRIKPMHLMHLPYDQSLGSALRFWNAEAERLGEYLTAHGGVPITAGRLQEEVEIGNAVRALMWEIVCINADGPPLLTGMQLLPVLESKSFMVEAAPYLAALRELRDELLKLRKSAMGSTSDRRFRILLTGTPVGKGSHKVLQLVEESGAVVVCQDNCSGIKGLNSPVRTEGDLFENVARRYLGIPCACMSPNPGRLRTVEDLCRDFGIHGIIDLTWQGCHGFNVESHVVRERAEQLGIPFLQIETGYSESDAEQIRTRIEAFLEGIL